MNGMYCGPFDKFVDEWYNNTMRKKTINFPLSMPFIPKAEYTGLSAVFLLLYVVAIYVATYNLLDFLTLFFFAKALPWWFKICTLILVGRWSGWVIALSLLVEGYILLSGHTMFPHL